MLSLMMSTTQLPGSVSTSRSAGEIRFLQTMSRGGCNCIPGWHVCLTSFLIFGLSDKRLPIRSLGQGSRRESLCLLVTADPGLVQGAVLWSSSLLGCVITLIGMGSCTPPPPLRTIPIFFLAAQFSKLWNFSRKFPRCVLDRGLESCPFLRQMLRVRTIGLEQALGCCLGTGLWSPTCS